MNPDRITEELSKIFTYNETETEKHNDTRIYYDFNKADMNQHANSHSAKGGASVSAEAYLSARFVSGGAKVSANAYGETADSLSNSLYNQLNQTTNNQFSSDDIRRMFTQQGTELAFKGEKRIPKSFQVYKLADLTDQVQVGIISKQLFAEKKDDAIVKTVIALNFPVRTGIVESTTHMILTGEIRLYSRNTTVLAAPWLFCNGSAVSRNEFPTLFRVIGTNYGSGDDVHTFNLSDFRGRVPVGVDELQVRATGITIVGSIGGQLTHQLTIDQIPPHQHSAGSLSTSPDGNHSHSISDPAIIMVAKQGNLTNRYQEVGNDSQGLW